MRAPRIIISSFPAKDRAIARWMKARRSSRQKADRAYLRRKARSV